jgi:hypothetical protein
MQPVDERVDRESIIKNMPLAVLWPIDVAHPSGVVNFTPLVDIFVRIIKMMIMIMIMMMMKSSIIINIETISTVIC